MEEENYKSEHNKWPRLCSLMQGPFVPTIPTEASTASTISTTAPSTETTAASTDAADTTADTRTADSPGLEDLTTSSTMPKKQAPFGSWPSPITSEIVFKDINKIIEPPRVDSVTGKILAGHLDRKKH